MWMQHWWQIWGPPHKKMWCQFWHCESRTHDWHEKSKNPALIMTTIASYFGRNLLKPWVVVDQTFQCLYCGQSFLYLIPSHHFPGRSCYFAHWCRTGPNLYCCCIHCNYVQRERERQREMHTVKICHKTEFIPFFNHREVLESCVL